MEHANKKAGSVTVTFIGFGPKRKVLEDPVANVLFFISSWSFVT